MTARKAPVEVLQALCEACDRWWNEPGSKAGRDEIAEKLSAYRAAIGPLRTREVRDREILRLIHGWADVGCGLMMGEERLVLLSRLCAEPTTDHAPDADSETIPRCKNCGERLQ